MMLIADTITMALIAPTVKRIITDKSNFDKKLTKLKSAENLVIEEKISIYNITAKSLIHKLGLRILFPLSDSFIMSLIISFKDGLVYCVQILKQTYRVYGLNLFLWGWLCDVFFCI